MGVNDVATFTTTKQAYRSYVTPGKNSFNRPQHVFASNAGTIGIVAKFTF